MSHGEHHLSAPGQSAPPASSSTSEYELTLPSRARSAYSPAVSPPPDSGAAPLAAVATGVAGTAGTMQDKDSLPLTQLERWATYASDSQFNALAGATGGFVSGIVTCPLDVIKTKLQAQGGFEAMRRAGHMAPGAGPAKVYQGLVGTASVIWREEGIRGMYRGLGPIILGYLPTWAVWFTVYNKSKRWMAQDRPPPDQKTTFLINFWSSIIAGASSTIVTNPIWVIKTRLMSQTGHHDRPRFSLYPKGANTPTSRPTLHAPWHYRSTWDAARKMYTTEGVLSFYSGLTPALLGLTHVAVQFPAYEYLKTRFTGQPMGAAPSGDEQQTAQWWGILSASILSKILASSATYPHEVIRTRLQTQRRPVPGQQYMQGAGATGPTGNPQSKGPKYKGVVMTFRTILREEGWRAFYAGLGTNMMRAVPAATVTMLTYEYVMRQLNGAQRTGREKIAQQGERVQFS